MTIKELIEILKNYDENLEVEISAECATYGTIKNIYLDGNGITLKAEY